MENEFLGTVAVYLVVLNELKVCAINAPLLLLSTGEKLTEFCQWLVDDADGLTIEEQVMYQTCIVTYNIVKDEEMKEQMGRKVVRPNYDNLAELLEKSLPPDVMNKFIQKLLHVDSPEVGAQRILGVDSPKEGVQKLLGVDSLEEAIRKLQESTTPTE